MSEESNGTVIPITDATPLTALQGGRPIKFMPERMEQIKNLVERGMSREEIAETIGVTLGSLQVTCSKHGISLRRPRPTIADRIGRSGRRGLRTKIEDSRIIARFQCLTTGLVTKRLGQWRPELANELYRIWLELEQRGLKKSPEYRNVMLRADRQAWWLSGLARLSSRILRCLSLQKR